MMNLLIFFAIALGALFIVAAVFQVALEIRRLRVLFETRFRLEPVVDEKSIRYKRKQTDEEYL